MRNAIIWAELVIAASLLAAGCAFAPEIFGPNCKTTPCTLYNHGVAVSGRCGSKKGDGKHCYCIAPPDHKLLQIQSGCALPGN